MIILFSIISYSQNLWIMFIRKFLIKDFHRYDLNNFGSNYNNPSAAICSWLFY